MSFTWEVTPTEAFEDLVTNYTQTIFVTGRFVAERRADQMVAWGRANAPWRDRSGEARQSLNAEVFSDDLTLVQIIVQHGVPYGVWLEIANGGRYAIIPDIIDHFGPIIMSDLQRMMNLGLVTLE